MPPFAIKNSDGSWEGVSIELWRQIAEELKLDFEFVELPLDQMLAKVESGEIAAAVAAITVTAERESRMDFSQPFYHSGLGLAVRKSNLHDWWSPLIRTVLGPLTTILIFITLMLVITGIIIWIVECKGNPDQFGGGAVAGIGHGIWWAAVTMTTVGYGDKAPKTVAGKIVALFWMFVGVVVLSLFTASIASRLTAESLRMDVRDARDLSHIRMGVVKDSTGDDNLSRNGISRQPYDDARNALTALENREIDAVLYDRPTLRYLVKEDYDGKLTVLLNLLDPEDYAIAFPAGSPRLEQVNRVLLKITRSDSWKNTLRRYLGPLD